MDEVKDPPSWYYTTLLGEKIGPISQSEVVELIAKRVITPDTVVCGPLTGRVDVLAKDVPHLARVADTHFIQVSKLDEMLEARNLGDYSRTNLTFSGLTVVFYVLSGLSLLGGLILALQFWPADSVSGRQRELEVVWSIIWIMAGVTEAALFAAIGRALSLLEKIAKATEK